MTLTIHEKKNCEIEVALHDLEKTKGLCAALMKTPHYSKIGEMGVFAIVQKANALGISPIDALNGALYFVQGKVEMSGQSMLALIRQHGHSVKIDPKSTNTHVVLHGKRCDNGDEWSVSFGIEDAKRAGIYKASWEKYPQAMCIWRCVSMLGRFLFSDVIKGTYVQGEISDAPPFEQPVEKDLISEFQLKALNEAIGDDSEYRSSFLKYLNRMGIEAIEKMPVDLFERALNGALRNREKNATIQGNIEVVTADLDVEEDLDDSQT